MMPDLALMILIRFQLLFNGRWSNLLFAITDEMQ